MHIVTMVDTQRVPLLLGLMANLEALTRCQFHVLDLCGKARDQLAQRPNLHWYQVSSLGLSEILKHRPDARSRAFTCKPHLISQIYEKVASPLLYCDVDLHFHRDPSHLIEEGRSAAVTVFPHFHIDAKNAHKYGRYNAGLLVAGNQALPFLQWWSRQCRQRCEESPTEGLFYDQRYLDEAVIRFSNVNEDLTGRHNIGPWTKNEKITQIASFHASAPDRRGLFIEKVLWDDLQAFLVDQRNSFQRRRMLQVQRLFFPDLHRLLRLQHKLARFNLPFPTPFSLSTCLYFGQLLRPVDSLHLWWKEKSGYPGGFI